MWPRDNNVQSSSVGDNKNAGKSLNAHQKIMQINYTAYSNTTRKRQVTEKGVTLTLLKSRKESGKIKKDSLVTQTNKQVTNTKCQIMEVKRKERVQRGKGHTGGSKPKVLSSFTF